MLCDSKNGPQFPNDRFDRGLPIGDFEENQNRKTVVRHVKFCIHTGNRCEKKSCDMSRM